MPAAAVQDQCMANSLHQYSPRTIGQLRSGLDGFNLLRRRQPNLDQLVLFKRTFNVLDHALRYPILSNNDEGFHVVRFCTQPSELFTAKLVHGRRCNPVHPKNVKSGAIWFQKACV